MAPRKSQGRYEVLVGALVLASGEAVPAGARVDLDDATAERMVDIGAVRDTQSAPVPAAAPPQAPVPEQAPAAPPMFTAPPATLAPPAPAG